MRLSDNINIKKTAPVPLPARNATCSVVGGWAKAAQKAPAAAPPAYSADLPSSAFVPTLREVGTKAGSKITQLAPSAKNGGFRMSALIKKKNITQAHDVPPVELMEQEPAVAEMPAQATDEPVIFTPQKTVPVTVKPSPVSPNRHEPTAELGQDGTGAQTPSGKTLRLPDLMTKKSVAPSHLPPPEETDELGPSTDGQLLTVAGLAEAGPGSPPPATTLKFLNLKKEEAVAEAPPRIMESTPPLAQADAPAAANASRYEEQPGNIYDICRHFGIAVSKDRTALIEQAQVCLVTIFKKIMLPVPEQYMIWPMIKSIASDLDGIIAMDTTVLNILHRYRAKGKKLVWHSIYTAILAMDLAKHEENLSCSVHEIGGAALLHDAGFLIQTTHGFDTNGFDNITDKKSPEFREHVDKSTELARRIEAPDAVVTMIAQHQGRLDGRGYPKNLSPSQFERYSQILAIASIFEHAIMDLSMEEKEAVPGNAGENSENGIAYVFREYRKAFDVDLLKKMIALVGFYPVNSIIELNNRAICKVVKQNNDFPLRPVVQVVMDGTGMHPEQEKLIDLKEIKVLSILRTIANFERKTKQE